MDFQLSDFHKDLVAVAGRLARDHFPEGAAIDRRGVERDTLPRAFLQVLASHGFAGMSMPEDIGGQGGKLLDAVLVIEAMAHASPIAGDCVQALNFGAIQQLANLGSASIVERYLTPCLNGEKVVTIAMSEPDAGSAVTDLRSRARVVDDTVIVNGQKLFTTNSEYADCFVVWVNFGDSSRTAGAVLVERDTPGFTIDSSHHFMSGDRYGMLYLDEARIPVDNILVQENGFRKMLAVFNVERLGNSARSLALGQAAFDLAVDHARTRRQFGRRLAEFQGLQWRFAEMKLKLDSARLLLYRAASNADAGLPSATETALAKLACNRAGFDVANDALQIFGGYGYDHEAAVNYLVRRTRGWMIAGGSIEQLLNRVAEGVFDERFSQRPPR
jgi:alkylation response protein AidB-like acyl-CoA dehydrogenase